MLSRGNRRIAPGYPSAVAAFCGIIPRCPSPTLSLTLSQRPFAPSKLLDALLSVDGIELSDLGRAQLEKLDLCPEIPEMHDRLIAVESMALGAPVLTRDEALTASPQIETVW